MPWCRALFLTLFCGPALAVDGFIVGGGVEGDAEDGVSAVAFADIGITESTRLYGAFGKSSVPLPRGIDLETISGDIGIDHWFDPIGVRLEAAYWGDSDVFDSRDARAALYWRNDKVTIAGDLEYREFEFDLFRADFRPGQDIQFHANGAGLSARFEVSQALSLSVSGIDYDYNVNLRRAANSDILDFLSVSRLSLLNSLIDYRVGVGIGLDVGRQSWDLNFKTWKGEADQSTTRSSTLSLITPLGNKSDIQFGFGVDDSDRFGSISFFSVHVYFYGGN